MKKICIILFFVLTAFSAIAQKNDYTVSFDGIGQLKLGMSKTDLEKLLQTKIVFKHIGVDVQLTESVPAKYLGKDVVLHFFRSFVEGIEVTDPLFKLADGTGIGTDQSTIINKYEHELLIMHPYYSYEDTSRKNAYTITMAKINSYDDAIMFTMVNKKVVAIEIGPTPQFRDRE